MNRSTPAFTAASSSTPCRPTITSCKPFSADTTQATRGGRVDVLLHALEANPPSLQLPDAFDQVFQGAPEAIQLPDDERVPSADKLECRLETFTLTGGTAGDIGEQFLASSFSSASRCSSSC
jgi:hypothetical protein